MFRNFRRISFSWFWSHFKWWSSSCSSCKGNKPFHLPHRYHCFHLILCRCWIWFDQEAGAENWGKPGNAKTRSLHGQFPPLHHPYDWWCFFPVCSHWSKQKLQSGKLYLHNVGTCSCLDFSSTICTQWSDPPHRVCFWCAADDFSLSYIKTNRACCVVQPAHNLTTKYWIRE